jgi:hypothetical protein
MDQECENCNILEGYVPGVWKRRREQLKLDPRNHIGVRSQFLAAAMSMLVFGLLRLVDL